MCSVVEPRPLRSGPLAILRISPRRPCSQQMVHRGAQNFDIAGRIGGTVRSGGLGFAPNGREPRLLMPRQSWRAVVMAQLREAGRRDVVTPSVEIEEAGVAIVAQALLVISSRI